MLKDSVDRYVAVNRAAGRVFIEQERNLGNYAAFAQERGEDHVRVRTVLAWLERAKSTRRRRELMMTVRCFALAVAVEDPEHEVPSEELVPRAPSTRPRPYIYSPSEISAIVANAEKCATRRCPVPGLYPTLFGLIAATGMRISEITGLDVGDVTADGLLIREAKRRGRRLLPLHATTEAALDKYLGARSRVRAATGAVFMSDRGQRLTRSTVEGVFLRILARVGLIGASTQGRNPRIHDMRHTFAVRSLESCGADRKAIARHMVALSNWLGHVNVSYTYWYLEGTDELMRRIAERTDVFRREAAS